MWPSASVRATCLRDKFQYRSREIEKLGGIARRPFLCAWFKVVLVNMARHRGDQHSHMLAVRRRGVLWQPGGGHHEVELKDGIELADISGTLQAWAVVFREGREGAGSAAEVCCCVVSVAESAVVGTNGLSLRRGRIPHLVRWAPAQRRRDGLGHRILLSHMQYFHFTTLQTIQR